MLHGHILFFLHSHMQSIKREIKLAFEPCGHSATPELLYIGMSIEDRKLPIIGAIFSLLVVTVLVGKRQYVFRQKEHTTTTVMNIVQEPDTRSVSLGEWTKDTTRYSLVVEKATVVGEYLDMGKIMRVDKVKPVGSCRCKHPLSKLGKQVVEYLGSGSFYYLENGERGIDKRVQCNQGKECPSEHPNYFLANEHLLAPRYNTASSQYRQVRAIKGVVVSESFGNMTATLISRHSLIRSGPRLESRGTDSQGNAATTVETELILYDRGSAKTAAFAVVRGSVPFNWSQSAAWTAPIPTPAFSADPKANADMIRKHVAELESLYGSPLVGISLVSHHGEEKPIGDMFVEASKLVSGFSLTAFDYHRMVSKHGAEWGKEMLRDLIQVIKQDIRFYHNPAITGHDIVLQEGVVRVNCLTVLDRTSAGQAQVMLAALPAMLEAMGASSSLDACSEWLRSAWARTADALSRQIGGTPAQQTDVIKKGSRTAFGAVKDAIISIGRHWHSNWDHKELFTVMKAVHGYSE